MFIVFSSTHIFESTSESFDEMRRPFKKTERGWFQGEGNGFTFVWVVARKRVENLNENRGSRPLTCRAIDRKMHRRRVGCNQRPGEIRLQPVQTDFSTPKPADTEFFWFSLIRRFANFVWETLATRKSRKSFKKRNLNPFLFVFRFSWFWLSKFKDKDRTWFESCCYFFSTFVRCVSRKKTFEKK